VDDERVGMNNLLRILKNLLLMMLLALMMLMMFLLAPKLIIERSGFFISHAYPHVFQIFFFSFFSTFILLSPVFI
jgi:hypothetical protein